MEIAMKRFWKQVTLDADRGVLLDGRPVRTPGRSPLLLETDALAQAVAEEWRAVGDTLDPRAMPLTGLANAAVDRIAPDPARFAADLARYGESDLLCYRADSPEPLVERQAAAWDPPLDWAQRRFDVGFERVTGIIHRAQPPATLRRLGEAVAALPPFTLAGLSPVVTLTGSLVLALMLVGPQRMSMRIGRRSCGARMCSRPRLVPRAAPSSTPRCVSCRCWAELHRQGGLVPA
jgi:chaperone required for assembly of F1-ATPase